MPHAPSPRRLALLAAVALAAATTAVGAIAATAPSTPTRPSVHTDPAEALSPLDLVRGSFGQVGTVMRLDLATATPFAATDLDAHNDRSLCLMLFGDGAATPAARLCAARDDTVPGGIVLRVTRLDAAGRAERIRRLPTPVTRPSDRELRADIPLGALGLTPGRFGWQARTRWRTTTGACATASACTDLLPDRGPVPYRVRPTRVTGCAFAAPAEVRTGPIEGRRIALTFDDGPAPITARILQMLEREKVPATFFVVGIHIPGQGALLRRMLADGDMIGNHTTRHGDLSAGGATAAADLQQTQRMVQHETGFTPCLFRPPYGAVSASLVATAGALHLTTVLWDVDPQDWRSPGADAIARGIVGHAHPGAIVLDHDGGGPREQTLAALPGVIRELKRRGYRFQTVNDLLGLPVSRG